MHVISTRFSNRCCRMHQDVTRHVGACLNASAHAPCLAYNVVCMGCVDYRLWTVQPTCKVDLRTTGTIQQTVIRFQNQIQVSNRCAMDKAQQGWSHSIVTKDRQGRIPTDRNFLVCMCRGGDDLMMHRAGKHICEQRVCNSVAQSPRIRSWIDEGGTSPVT